jgi:hypothetical protein
MVLFCLSDILYFPYFARAVKTTFFNYVSRIDLEVFATNEYIGPLALANRNWALKKFSLLLGLALFSNAQLRSGYKVSVNYGILYRRRLSS